MLNKKCIKVLLAIGIIFFLYIEVWGTYVAFRYEPFRKKLGDTVGYNTSSLKKDGYQYSVFKPHFLSFTGNLHITKLPYADNGQNDEIPVDIIIWPCGINDYKVGVGISGPITYYSEYSSHRVITDMVLDKDMNLLDDTPEKRALYEQNLDEIETLYHLAYEMWGILELE